MTTPVLTITRGLPGSRKTTWARQQPGYRVNRDDLRAMLRPVWPHGARSPEDVCTIAQHAQIAALLRAGVHVICDDTNLLDEHVRPLREIAVNCGARVEIVDFTWVPLETCISHDAARPTPVGAPAIRRMWAEYLADQAVRR